MEQPVPDPFDWIPTMLNHQPLLPNGDLNDAFLQQLEVDERTRIQGEKAAECVSAFKRIWLSSWVPDFLEDSFYVHQPPGGWVGLNSHPEFMDEDAYREFRMHAYQRAEGWVDQMCWDLRPETKERVLHECSMVVYRYLNQCRSWNQRVLRNLRPEPLPPRDRSGDRFTRFIYAV